MAEARERGQTLAMLLIDLDGFKSINDSFGHATGDTLLKLAASRLHQQLRNSDLFGRFSDDEFVVVLRDLSEPEDAGHVARKLLAALTEPLRKDHITLKVSASIGIAMQASELEDFDSLLRASDAAMYAATESGRNHLPLLQPGRAVACPAPAGAGACAARRAGPGGIFAGLSAAGTDCRRKRSGDRSPAALAPAGTRLLQPGRVHPDRRGVRARSCAWATGCSVRPAARRWRGTSRACSSAASR